MKLFLVLILMSSVAFGQDIQCTGVDNINALIFKKNELHVYKISATRILRGDFVTLEEIGSPRVVDIEKEKLRTYYRGEGFEFVTKNGMGILTDSQDSEIRSKEYFCSPYVAPIDSRPPSPRPCLPRNCP